MFVKFWLLVFLCFVAVEGSNTQGSNKGLKSFCKEYSNPCRHGGQCLDNRHDYTLGESYKCQCRPGCYGQHCENCPPPRQITPPQGPCYPNPCRGDCTCTPSCKHAHGYYCQSSSGYLGKNCTIPPPTLVCHSNSIVLTVSEQFVREYDMGLGNSYLATQPNLSAVTSCKHRTPANGQYQISIPMPFNACGTMSKQLPGGNMVFKNQLWFNRDLKNTGFDMPVPAIEFECTYAREYEVVTSLQPLVPTPATVTGMVRVSPEISLCKSQSCPAACPSHMRVPARSVYTVGENIHVAMSLDTGSHVTTVDRMFISCSADTLDSSNMVEIINSGCGTTSGLPCKVTHNGASHRVCVTFQTPRGLCNQIYIHAKLSSCYSSSMTTCTGGAHYGTKCSYSPRRRRSVEENKVIGPFYIISGSSGVPSVRMYPENDLALEMEHDKMGVQRNGSPPVMDQRSPFDTPPSELDEPNQKLWIALISLTSVFLVCVLIAMVAKCTSHRTRVAAFFCSKKPYLIDNFTIKD